MFCNASYALHSMHVSDMKIACALQVKDRKILHQLSMIIHHAISTGQYDMHGAKLVTSNHSDGPQQQTSPDL